MIRKTLIARAAKASSTLILLTAGCGATEGAGEQDQGDTERQSPSDEDRASRLRSFAVNTATDQPTCDDELEGALIYVKDSEEFKTCQSSAWEVISIKGEKGDTGEQGPQGEAGPAGTDATAKIAATISCIGNFSTLSEAGRTYGGYVFPTTLTIYYKAAVFSNGDTLSTGEVSDSIESISGTSFYSSQQNGSLTAPVSIVSDRVGNGTAGYWTVAVDRVTGVATVTYFDPDFEASEKSVTWTFLSSACTIQSH